MARAVRSPRKDKRVFNATAKRTHRANYLVPRGGVRK